MHRMREEIARLESGVEAGKGKAVMLQEYLEKFKRVADRHKDCTDKLETAEKKSAKLTSQVRAAAAKMDKLKDECRICLLAADKRRTEEVGAAQGDQGAAERKLALQGQGAEALAKEA